MSNSKDKIKNLLDEILNEDSDSKITHLVSEMEKLNAGLEEYFVDFREELRQWRQWHMKQDGPRAVLSEMFNYWSDHGKYEEMEKKVKKLGRDLNTISRNLRK